MFLDHGVALKFSKLSQRSILVSIGLVLALLISPAPAQSTNDSKGKSSGVLNGADSSKGRISIHISSIDSLRSGQFDTLDIAIESVDHVVAGFSLKIASTNEQLEVVQIVQGTLLDSCGWELFSASPLAQDDNRPTAVWRISGLAKMSADTVEPDCLASGRRVSIAKVIVTSSHSSDISTPMPVFFFWEDCRDNTVSDKGGRQLYVSDRVLDYVPIDYPESQKPFPNRTGAPPSCVSPKSTNAPKRQIEFHNGGVKNSKFSSDH